MILFDMLINFIEAFFFTYFICQHIRIKQKYLYLSVITLLHFSILHVSSIINYYGIFLTLFIIIFMILSIYIFKREINFYYVYTVIFYNSILMLCLIPSILLIYCFQNIINPDTLYVFRCILAKIIQITTTFILLKYYTPIYTLDIKSNKNIIVYETSIVTILVIIIYSLTLNITTINTLYILLLFSVIIVISFQRTIHKIEEMNKEKIEYIKDKETMEFNRQKYYTVSHIKQEIEEIDHRLFYTIYKINELLDHEEYDKIRNITKEYENKILKRKISIDTHNKIFDTLYSFKINELINNNVNVNNYIFINKNDFYNNLIFINTLTELLDYYKHCDDLHIQFDEENEYLKIQIIHYGNNVNKEDILNFLDDKSKTYDFKYNCQSFDKKGLKLLFKIGEIHDKTYN